MYQCPVWDLVQSFLFYKCSQLQALNMSGSILETLFQMVAHSTAIIFLTCFYSCFNVFSCFLVASHATQLDFPTPLPVFRLHVAVPPWPLPVQCFACWGVYHLKCRSSWLVKVILLQKCGFNIDNLTINWTNPHKSNKEISKHSWHPSWKGIGILEPDIPDYPSWCLESGILSPLSSSNLASPANKNRYTPED